MDDHALPTLPVNESGMDRGIRILLGLALFAIGVAGVFAEPAAGATRLMALVPIASGALGWCPIYQVLHVDTCREEARA